MKRAVVVTGLGAISAFGAGVETLAAALAAGLPCLREVDRSQGFHRNERGARLAAMVDPATVAALIGPAAARRMSAPSRFAVAAARLALRDAGLAEDDALFAQTAVVVATAFGPSQFSERLIATIFGPGPQEASPALFTESVASAAAAQVALNFKALGPSVTLTQREAGGLLALGEGARLVSSGRAERVLVGAVDELTPLLHAVLDRFQALARPDATGAESARPFDRDRDGLVIAEGAAVAVLESAEAASARGARPRCRIVATGAGFDASAAPWSWGQGASALGRQLLRVLERGGIEPAQVDRIASGASGSVAGDRIEALTLRSAWREAPLPPVLAPKATLGEYAGSQLGAAVLAASGSRFGPTPGFRVVDPELGVVPHDGSELAPPRFTLATSLAAGGAAAWALLERV